MCYEYSLNFVGEREGRKKTYELAISLYSIKFPNNFILTKSNNLFKSNKITNFNKKTHFKPTCLCIVRYVRFTDTIRFIRYAPMHRTIHEHLQDAFTMWNFLYTIRYVSYDTDNRQNKTIALHSIWLFELHNQQELHKYERMRQDKTTIKKKKKSHLIWLAN